MNTPVEAVVAPIVVEFIVPPVIATVPAFWTDIVPKPLTSAFEIASKVLTWDVFNAIGVAAETVLLPIILLAAKFAILVSETAPAAIVPVAVILALPSNPGLV